MQKATPIMDAVKMVAFKAIMLYFIAAIGFSVAITGYGAIKNPGRFLHEFFAPAQYPEEY
jgi:hypothetical protein